MMDTLQGEAAATLRWRTAAHADTSPSLRRCERAAAAEDGRDRFCTAIFLVFLFGALVFCR